MPQQLLKNAQSAQSKTQTEGQAGGFILLEVLLAMSLVLTVWIGSVNTYQVLVLRMGQEQQKRVHIHQESDQHEIKQSQKRNQ
ncbi:MAG: hypothetical protein B7X83_07750 [Polynucleobacter sp. 17-46-58]|nr:MAG: hypothetical protein B7Y55_10050 [Polynucleobacter sp. 35-46-207]OZA32725.1 MAG: hypothetical protein B7X83_07750 [Polynucleobacter sp. 17-46-58]